MSDHPVKGRPPGRDRVVSRIGRDAVTEKGMSVFRLMEPETPAVFGRGWWAGQAMRLALRDPDFKVRLFRFIDAFPSLATPDMAASHLRDYFPAGGTGIPGVARLAAARPAAGAATALLSRAIARFARTFIAGATVSEAVPVLSGMWEEGRTFTVDLLGEAAVSEAESLRYRDLYLSLLDDLSRETARWAAKDPEREAVFPRLNVSVKISSLYSRIGPANFDDSVLRVKERLRPIMRKAKEVGAFVNLDTETYALKDITLSVFTGLLEEPDFADFRHGGIAIQAYLKDARRDIERLAAWAREGDRSVTVRLVKGAYWEYETIVAAQKGWEIPVFTVKGHTDWNFERCVEAVFTASDRLTLAAGTHNVRSIAKVLAETEARGIPRSRYEFQMLYGMADPVKKALAKMGHPVRDYVPVGDLLPGMAYLVRRLLENSSNAGFLRRLFVDDASPEELLAEPEPYPGDRRPAFAVLEAPETAAEVDPGPFRNEPFLDFTRREAREACQGAIEAVRTRLGREYPAVVGGKERRAGEAIVSVNPARSEEVVGRVAGITAELGEQALEIARKGQKAWARRRPADRAAVLFRAARIARTRKEELAAWQIFEVGKNRVEADADVAEAIDHLEYYGREAIRLGETRRMGVCPGEENGYFYQPRGVGVVIAPWNFPLAISVGMVSAALVAGNAVLYKPSSLSPVNGWLAFSLLREAGAPEDVLHFIPGRGEAVGNRLVEHRDTDFVLFTGSRDVGLGIVERAGKAVPGQKSVKRVVAEMGGKNAVIVDADADLDQAVPEIVRSAFGFQGQKCSACSRVIVHAACCNRFLDRLAEAVRSIAIGPPDDPAFFMGPVIDARARERIQEYVALGRREGSASEPVPVPETGWYVPPTILTGLPPGSRILREEIFGPVLAVVRVRDIEEALAVANDSEYALTGGLFSRSPSTIARVREEFAVGNLYINRGITGAVVGRQPFGGFRMSGVGSKAGGPDYLLQFLEPRVVTENTVRRGFSPDRIS
jgi:RHH-type transcriptional regulator, proline utilization regulon repressor / proline dehydrogenase / delta 1-pyrroline-5-carboxylate dehydrogenase